MSQLEWLIVELKRRPVYRVAVVYAALAFVLWQTAQIAVASELPDWDALLVVVLTAAVPPSVWFSPGRST